VAQAQRRMRGDPIVEKLDEVTDRLETLQANVARLERKGQ